MNRVPPGPAWLFCPADRVDRYKKAAARADVVILDLEDAVAASDKASARESLVSELLDPDRTVVRINPFGTPDFELDREVLDCTPYRYVMLPKCEGPEQVSVLEHYDVIPIVETPLGAVVVFETLGAANAVGVMWGAEDLTAALGGRSSRFSDGRYRDVARHVRSQSLLAAKARAMFALDSVYLDIGDHAGLKIEVDDAAAIGFDGKVAIHPGQVSVIRAAYAPTAEQIAWATRLLDAVEGERGVFSFEGQMVDAPVLRQAERILNRLG